ncbi:nicotinamide riboside transporter PnuC [uncultured Stenotrophomonas sp.]|uniref:nicotinamide riboside transporter PnuC n=1 Tax=uncultured Stenotrophomonas sp. TaxID=165438 RepID=UPI0028EB84CE|nr:nicotinamide riboside transporter PnuC [uncultured Stenotrophomonas sp.]
MTTALEIAANVTVAASILLAGRNSVHTWWTGIIGCSLFALVFYEARLYADVVLQGVFVVTSVIGWWQWLRGDHGHALPITNVRLPTLAWILPAAVLASIGYGWLLHTWTDAYAPFLDSAILVLSVVAQLLMMRRKLHSWWFWLMVNSVAVPLYATRGLHLTALLYVVFWINAVVSLRHWRRLMREQSAPAEGNDAHG